MSERHPVSPKVWVIPRLVMLAGVLAWLWPFGLGGRMPVGGDATQFSMGLMAVLRESIRSGRLPLWNDLWGFGFPGLAESQMGVFYPPHLVLYGAFATSTAYSLSLTLHTLWGALGANWASRRFGISEVGAALAGFCWATCGFFLIHLPHQWGYTVGSWMPWAFGLAWMIARGEGSRRTPWVLSAVLAFQVLPGHFQLAFVTEVSVLVMVLAGSERSVGRIVAGFAAVLGMVPLASLQLWPTFQLARLSASRRDYEYLSGFAATPLHYIDLIAPGLFHRSPLWRPVAWDPFHTSPEELLGYVGLVPLFLALGAVVRGWKVDRGVRTLALVVLVTLVLSLGPYVPGFSWLIRLPGFSFFRAPARWELALSLALCLLAGKGFDRLGEWPRLGRSTRRFAFASLGLILLVLGGFELALAASKGDNRKPEARAFDAVFRIMPWASQPKTKPFRAVMAEAYRPQSDLRIFTVLARLNNGKAVTSTAPTLARERFSIYSLELTGTCVLLGAFLVLRFGSGRPRFFASSLLCLALVDSLFVSGSRPGDLGPVAPLTEQSSVLASLATEPRGTRTLDPAQNLFMVAGVAPVSAYRTLDLPSPGGLIELARGPIADPKVIQALRVAGVDLRVIDPLEARDPSWKAANGWAQETRTIPDSALSGWLLGVGLTRSLGLRDFVLLRARVAAPRAWLMPSSGLAEADLMGDDPTALLAKFRRAIPQPFRSDFPEQAEVEVKVVDANPSMVVLSRTFDPEWQAWWTGPSGERRSAKVVKVLGGWQGVAIPEPGRWTLHLEYPGTAVKAGLSAASLAWSVWLTGVLWPKKRRRQGIQPEVVA